jgi:Ca2+-binding RTX toxin-like protein
MTNIVASKSYVTSDVDLLDFAAGVVTVAGATTYRVTRGTSYDELTGAFTYDSAGQLAGGTITGWKQVTDGGVAFTATGLSLPVADFLGFLALNDTEGFLEQILGGGDKIAGSNLSDTISGRGGDDSVAGGGGDQLEGGDGADTLDGASGDDALLGGNGNDSLLGGTGADVLEGGLGTDTMAGGGGGDLYVVLGGVGDVVIEAAAQGIDTVLTDLASFSLAALPNVEHLALVASESTGTGNALNNRILALSGDNTLIGGDGNDTLDSGSGADSLVGGKGDDTFVIDNAGDAVSETPGEGTDTIQALVSFTLNSPAFANFENLTLLGGALDGSGNESANVIAGNDADNRLTGLEDTLAGGGGKDTLDGGDGLDLLNGGDGDDTYVVDNAGDKVVEGAGLTSGFDRVAASVSYALTANVEELILLDTMGSGPSSGIGNAGNNNLFGNGSANKLLGLGGNDLLEGGGGDDLLDGGVGLDDIKGGAGADTLLGGAGDDFLDGSLGADSMAGGAGNDFYTIDDAGDLVSELPGQGTDAVVATIDTKLGANFENLFLLGSAAQGAGNDLNNRIEGTGGNNTLIGGLGNDTLDGAGGADSLIGGKGNDTYIIDNGGDTVSELPNEGTDTVQTSLGSFSLAGPAFGHVENLTLLAEGSGIGNDLANVITGTDGFDELDGAGGNDTMIGGKLDDIYRVNSAGDKVVELAGADSGTDIVVAAVSYTMAANVEYLNLIGTVAINGTGNASDNSIEDVVGSDNKLSGLQGNDGLFGGGGNDTLDGGGGNDTLNGGAGNDTLAGGDGNDLYTFIGGDDTVVEGAGQGIDAIWTPLSEFSLDSKALANVENLLLLGGAAKGSGNALSNAITGGNGNDTLSGGLGDDTLDGGAGADSLIGGKGNDTFVIDNDGDKVSEAPAEGADTIHSSLVATGLAAFANVENLTLIGSALLGEGNGLANVITGNDESNELIGGGGNDTLIGGAGEDTLSGGFGAHVLMTGGHGNDIHLVNSGSDKIVEAAGKESGIDSVLADVLPGVSYTLAANVENLVVFDDNGGTGNGLSNEITGGNGNNKLLGLGGNDDLYGEAGNDTLDGGADQDDLRGDAGDDSLLGGAGHDLLFGGTGADTLVGGAGNDFFVVDDLGDTVMELAGQGFDSISTTLVNFSLDTDALRNIEQLFVQGVGTGNALGNSIIGSEASNTLIGGLGNDTLEGYIGADSLVGGKGNDFYIVDDAGDVIGENPGEGVNTVQSSRQSTSLAGPRLVNVENLTLVLSALNGTGNGLANVITGTDGNNILDGGAGNDTMIGGKGTDTYFVSEIQDKVVELANAGFDVVNASVDYTLAANVETLNLLTGAFKGTGNAADNGIIGNAAANKLLGLAGNDGLIGEAGDDTLDGGTGNDALSGGDGNDSLFGGANDDVLDGGAGGDSMAGGAGNDRYVVNGAGDQVIELAGQGLDEVIVEAGSYTLGANVEDADLFNNAAATGNALANLISGDAIFSGDNALSGGAGNDTLVGGLGADTMTGGAGRDRFLVGGIDAAPEIVTDFDAGPLGDALDLTPISISTMLSQLACFGV